MDYERIQKHQLGYGGGGGGFSPGKLRSMLMGMEKKRRGEEEVESSTFNLTSQVTDVDESGGSGSENCKDVDVVSVLPECSTSESMAGETFSEHSRVKDQFSINSRIRSQQEPFPDYDSTSLSSSSMFEFQKSERATQRKPVAPFSKPAPSKWDDAQKWIASPTSNRPRGGGKKAGNVGSISRQSSTKAIVTYEEPETKQMDTYQSKKEGGWEAGAFPIADSYSKPVLMVENSVSESTISLSQHDSSIAMQSATTFIPPPSTARSVSMRDMGTEMTPIASQEPSRTGTPVRSTTPIRSPTSSSPSTPGRTAPSPSPTNLPKDHQDLNKELSEKELQMKTRREIIALGTQLGKANIAAWASKEEEDKDASMMLKTVAKDQQTKSVTETRAAAWEEAEKAKYMARFKREEMKIQAWENHQKAKTEAEMRKVEVEVERIRGRAHDKLMNKLAAVRHKAEEKRAAADAKRNKQAAKTEQQADYIRRTGRIPSSFSCWGWCY